MIKSVDDFIGQCLSVHDCYDTLAIVFTRVIQKEMVLAEIKFKFSQEMKNGVFLLLALPGGEVQIGPDPELLKEILDVKSPTCKTELLSLLG